MCAPDNSFDYVFSMGYVPGLCLDPPLVGEAGKQHPAASARQGDPCHSVKGCPDAKLRPACCPLTPFPLLFPAGSGVISVYFRSFDQAGSQVHFIRRDLF